jgi:hypothetical protein
MSICRDVGRARFAFVRVLGVARVVDDLWERPADEHRARRLGDS